ncbi:MAG: YIP1 family protein [Opitutales bacterium]
MIKSNSTVPLLTLWYKPGQTLQGLIAVGAGHTGAVVITALFGLVQAWRLHIAGDESGSLVLVAGMAVALLGLFLYGWLIRNFGRWLGSESRPADVRTALGWGLLPWLVLFAGLSLLMAQSGDVAQLATVYPFFFVAFVYGYIILLLALSAALRISVLKTFLCLVVTCLVSIFPITFIAQLVFGLSVPNP